MVTGKLLYWKKRAKYDEVYKVVSLSNQEIKLIQTWRRMPHLLRLFIDLSRSRVPERRVLVK